MEKKYFEYDEIEYYQYQGKIFDIVRELDNNKSKSSLDSIKFGIFSGKIPKDISDSLFLSYLEKFDYKKASIPKNKFKNIDSIFIETY